MRLSAKLLKSVTDVNHFAYANELYVRASDHETEATDLYIQLVDLDQDGIRYMPTAPATLSALFPALMDEDAVTIAGVQPFAQDASIWRIPVAALDRISSGNMIFTLTENGVTKRFVVQNALIVENVDQGSCC